MPPRKMPLQDVVSRPPSPRSSRSSVTPPTPPQAPPVQRGDVGERPPVREQYGEIRTGKRRRGLGMVGGILGALILVIGIGAVFLFAGAEVTITEKRASTPVDMAIEGMRSGGVTSGTLPFEILTLDTTKTKTLPATGEETVSEPASGTIVIYNNFSTGSQQLIKNTRFETPEGLIFRIRDSISVPGQKTEGGTTVPGSIEAVVYADEAGEKYNIALADFTIPGFKGSPRFEGFYARSKTPMTGGFVGTRKVVSEADDTRTRAELQAELRTALIEQAVTEKPAGYLLLSKGSYVSFESVPNVSPDGSNVTLGEKGIFHGIIVKETDLAGIIAEKNVAGYDSAPVTLTNSDALTIEPVLTPEMTTPWTEEKLGFTVKGSADILWIVDTAKLAADLAGKDEEALTTVLSGYPGVERAKAVLRPLWRQSFPTDPADITITITTPGEGTE